MADAEREGESPTTKPPTDAKAYLVREKSEIAWTASPKPAISYHGINPACSTHGVPSKLDWGPRYPLAL